MRKVIPFVVAVAFLFGMTAMVSAAQVKGKVTDKDGKAVADAKVMLFKAPAAKPKAKNQVAPEKAPAGEKPKPIAEATTGADGTYTLDGVAAGDYVVRAMAKGVGMGMAKVTVADANVTADITLQPPKAK